MIQQNVPHISFLALLALWRSPRNALLRYGALYLIDAGGSVKSLFLRFVESLGAQPSRDTILAAISTTIAWGPLMRKRISRLTAETLPWYLRLYGVMIGASIPARHHQHGSLCGISREERFSRWSMADVLFLALTGEKPTEAEARPRQASRR